MVAVGGFLRQFGPHDGDDRRESIAEVVDGVHDNGHRPGQPSRHSFEGRKEDVGGDTHQARSDDLLISIHFFFISLLLAKVGNI